MTENQAAASRLPTDRPHILTSFNVDKNFIEKKLKGKIEPPKPPEPEISFDKIVELIDGALKEIFKALIPLTNNDWVMMKNKKVWYDKATAGLFPKFEAIEFPIVRTNDHPVRNWRGLDFEGFHFVLMTPYEIKKSFIKGRANPYMDYDGTFRNFPVQSRCLLSNEEKDSHQSHFVDKDGKDYYWFSYDLVTIIPICRLDTQNSAGLIPTEAIKAWLRNNLIPEDLPSTVETKYKALLADYPTLEPYLNLQSTIDIDRLLDKTRLKEALEGNRITKNILGIDVSKARVQPKPQPERLTDKNLLAAVKKYLCDCDRIRANIMPYEEQRLVDINLGHWELFEDLSGADKVDAEAGKPFVARPPQLDIKDGVCAIDFGTKSTVVACRARDTRLLRVGMGDYKKAATLEDYENPTVIEFRDLENFMEAYKAREGRPYTEWEQMTVSHQAESVLNRNDASLQDSAVYYSVFSDLKQWANDKDRRLLVRDQKGATPKDLPPYLELKEGDFDPIEVYAYYLGLYINNMHRQIYLDYLLSFPVTYEQRVRERIRQSFERGLRKSLPPAVLADENAMKRFRVYQGANEPAAYAISALQEFQLEPKEVGEKIAYAVFDLGGGTTDFDFGVEYIPSKRRSKFEIEQFESGGNPHLGGERILDRLAYEVYKLNLGTMREKQIQFVLPTGAAPIAGTEHLITTSVNASQKARMNSKILAGKLRDFWERRGEWEKNFDGKIKVSLFKSADDKGNELENIELDVKKEVLERCIEDCITSVVEDFFVALFHAFQEHDLAPIHIFLAGNSCKSPVVQSIFKSTMQTYEELLKSDIESTVAKKTDNLQIFKLYPPLGQKFVEDSTAQPSDQQSNDQQSDQQSELHIDKIRTGKTGVAFGLLRSRIGGRDVKIVTASKEADFPYYLGAIDFDGHFKVSIGKDVAYKEWRRFTFADEPEFELYYTKNAAALENKLSEDEVNGVRLLLDADELSDNDDAGVYICKVAPDRISYAVGRESDFASGEFDGKKHEARLTEGV